MKNLNKVHTFVLFTSKITGIAGIHAIPVIFEVNQKKVWTFFPYNFCGDFRRTCNPRDNYMHFTVDKNQNLDKQINPFHIQITLTM